MGSGRSSSFVAAPAPARRRRAPRSPYYPDTMSRDARRVIEAAQTWRGMQEWITEERRNGFPTGAMLEGARDVACWRASLVIGAA